MNWTSYRSEQLDIYAYFHAKASYNFSSFRFLRFVFVFLKVSIDFRPLFYQFHQNYHVFRSVGVMPRGRVPRKPLFKVHLSQLQLNFPFIMFRLQVVVRRLPGALTFEELQEQMSPMPDTEYVWFEPSKTE